MSALSTLVQPRLHKIVQRGGFLYPILQIVLIHKDGKFESAMPCRMDFSTAEEMARNTIDADESLMDYIVSEWKEEEADEYL